MKPFCEGMETSMVQGEAQRQGRPAPSTRVIELPALGTAEAKASGHACVGGTTMKRLNNGWEQLNDPAGGWQRCREK